jgi:hypothetical protein
MIYDLLLNTAPTLLILAGHDRLDTPLTIAHMKGKFQYKVSTRTFVIFAGSQLPR